MSDVPALIPVTNPEVPTSAVPALALLHMPPAVLSDSDTLKPEQTVKVPVGTLNVGATFTETTAVAYEVPQELVTA